MHAESELSTINYTTITSPGHKPKPFSHGAFADHSEITFLRNTPQAHEKLFRENLMISSLCMYASMSFIYIHHLFSRHSPRSFWLQARSFISKAEESNHLSGYKRPLVWHCLFEYSLNSCEKCAEHCNVLFWQTLIWLMSGVKGKVLDCSFVWEIYSSRETRGVASGYAGYTGAYGPGPRGNF